MNAAVLPIDPRLEPSLVAVTAGALADPPAELRLESVVWGGAPAPLVEAITIEDDGTLKLEAEPPCADAIVSDPAEWDASRFEAAVAGHGRLVISKGASTFIRHTFGTEGSRSVAVLRGWCWSAGGTGGVPLFAAPIRFMTARAPIVLWMPRGNMLIVVNDTTEHGWCFRAGDRRVYLLQNQTRWYFAVVGRGETWPDPQLVHLVRSAIGFAIGEPLGLGLFQPLQDDRVSAGLAHLGLTNRAAPDRDGARAAPAISPESTSAIVDFVERVVALALLEPEAPVLEAIHLYFASLSGFIESKFLHAWLGTEALARWGILSGRFPDPGPMRLADHAAWRAWVDGHAPEIEALAAPGMSRSLLDRVRGAEIDGPTRVQRAFRGLGMPWTDEMDDAERARHGVAHEGGFPDAARDWDRDLGRVGLCRTMLTALLAKVAGYEGPIADRAKTSSNPTGSDQPAWWSSTDPQPDVRYHGVGVDEMIDAARARLESLADEDA